MICSCSIIAAIPFFELSLDDLACSAVWTVEEQEPLHPPMPTIPTSVSVVPAVPFVNLSVVSYIFSHRVPSIYSRSRLDL